jgi:radical SAM-linked protein
MNEKLELLKDKLKMVQRPARYAGGEYGEIHKEHSPEMLKIAFCFPDMYEIGMSNNALKLIYSYLNRYDNIVCERVFAPADDFSELLEENNFKLFSIESGTDIKDFDILAFTVGSELLYTNILHVLKLSDIPLDKTQRTDKDPVVIAGGPAITNPYPLEQFLDGVHIGEIESELEGFYKAIADFKPESNNFRDYILNQIEEKDYFWNGNSDKKVYKSVWADFNDTDLLSEYKPLVPNMRAVQDHAVVEIMRGCPNGCRFCHAGIFYRPKREKSTEIIFKEADNLVFNGGYRDITLSSLSTGDYSLINETARTMIKRFEKQHISVSLPSIKVNSFTLDLLRSVSENKKSGLTFAVEAANEAVQMSLNKPVKRDTVCSIIDEAKSYGWKLAKLYFMIGLPESDDNEADQIIEYIDYVQKRTGIRLNVNIGTFIPKPHTPYEASVQLNPETALERLKKIKEYFYRNRQVKISFHDPYTSYIEGILSRGGKEISKLLLDVYDKGCRFDAWDEHFKKDIWLEEISNGGYATILNGKEVPWNNISLGVSDSFLKKELKKSEQQELTEVCSEDCDHLCGSCNKKHELVNAKPDGKDYTKPSQSFINGSELEQPIKAVIRYRKHGKIAYIGHIDTQSCIEKLLIRTTADVVYTQGFNKKPKIEIVNPLPLGATSECEYLLIQLNKNYDKNELLSILNEKSPKGLDFEKIDYFEISDFKTLEKEFIATYFDVTVPEKYLNKEIDLSEIEEIIEQDSNKFHIKILRNGKGIFKIIDRIVSPEYRYYCDVTRVATEFKSIKL